MKTVNEVRLTGRLGKDPEHRTFTNGGGLTNLTLATDHSYKPKDSTEWVKQTEWHNVVVKGNFARDAAEFKKGQMVTLTGRLQTRSYESGGAKRFITEVVTFKIEAATE